MPRPTTPLRWAERTNIERVRLYVVGSLYVLFVLFMGLGLLSALMTLPETAVSAFAVGLCLVLTAGGLLCLRAVLEVDAPRAPDRVALGLLLGGCAIGQVVAWTRPPESGFSLAMFVVFGLSWGLAGVEDRRVWWSSRARG